MSTNVTHYKDAMSLLLIQLKESAIAINAESIVDFVDQPSSGTLVPSLASLLGIEAPSTHGRVARISTKVGDTQFDIGHEYEMINVNTARFRPVPKLVEELITTGLSALFIYEERVALFLDVSQLAANHPALGAPEGAPTKGAT